MKPWPLFATLVFFHASVACASDPGAKLRFERDIQPLLTRCVTCHGAAKSRGGLRLDSKAGAIAMLDSGNKAVEPGRPQQSELLSRVRATDPNKQMPPKGERLTAAQVNLLERWIGEGAQWPAHWAYRPLTAPPLPSCTSVSPTAVRTPIDQFIQAELKEHGLSSAPEADKATLLRRVTFDLTGLPPTAPEQAAFLVDTGPGAYERLVDRLLASPHHGERWARHWMDVVHFAETHGNDQDRPREHAWPYRDYLIRAFNQDTPYARFLQEQIAGDSLFPNDPWATVATGFLAAGPWDESSLRDIREDSIDREIGRYLDRDDIVSTVMGTFASTTAHCARCHDHKFDPIAQKEYYALQAVFANTDKANRAYDPDPNVAARRRQLSEQRRSPRRLRASELEELLRDSSLQKELAAWESQQSAARRRWLVLEPSALRSAAGTVLTPLADGSILATGPRPDKDTYTVIANLGPGPVTAIRLELLIDGSLPNRGPGRQDNGNLHLNEFSVVAASKADTKRVLAWGKVQADFNQDGWTIAQAVDQNPKTAWGIFPQVGKNHQAVFTLAQPIADGSGVTLMITIQQTHGQGHVIGRFRLAVADTPEAGEVEPLPAEIADHLEIVPDRRTNRQRVAIGAHFLKQKLERDWAAAAPRQNLALLQAPARIRSPMESFRPSAARPRQVFRLVRGEVRNRAEESTTQLH